MNNPCYVMDACALIALINNESGHEAVRELLKKSEQGLCNITMHALNLCEVYYDCLRTSGSKVADALLKAVETMPLTIIENIDGKLLKEAGKIKASEKVSLADSIAVGLAVTLSVQLITADHHEFETLATNKTVKVFWFR